MAGELVEGVVVDTGLGWPDGDHVPRETIGIQGVPSGLGWPT